MALTRANVRVAVTGGVYRGVSGTTVPTTVDGVLHVALKDQGYVGEDGITQSIDKDTTDITAWQGSDIVREVQTSHKLTYQLKLIEVNPETLKTVYGNHTTGTTLITGATLPASAWVFNVVDGENLIRLVIPDGQVHEIGDVVYAAGEEVGHEITITCYPDASGVKAYLYNGTAA